MMETREELRRDAYDAETMIHQAFKSGELKDLGFGLHSITINPPELDYLAATCAMYAGMREPDAKPWPWWFKCLLPDTYMRWDSPANGVWINTQEKSISPSSFTLESCYKPGWSELTPAEGREAEARATAGPPPELTPDESEEDYDGPAHDEGPGTIDMSKPPVPESDEPAPPADFWAWWESSGVSDSYDQRSRIAEAAWHAALATVATPKPVKGFLEWWDNGQSIYAEPYDLTKDAYAAGASSLADPTLTPLQTLAEAGYWYFAKPDRSFFWNLSNGFGWVAPAGPDAFARCHRAMSEHFQKRGEK